MPDYTVKENIQPVSDNNYYTQKLAHPYRIKTKFVHFAYFSQIIILIKMQHSFIASHRHIFINGMNGKERGRMQGLEDIHI